MRAGNLRSQPEFAPLPKRFLSAETKWAHHGKTAIAGRVVDQVEGHHHQRVVHLSVLPEVVLGGVEAGARGAVQAHANALLAVVAVHRQDCRPVIHPETRSADHVQVRHDLRDGQPRAEEGSVFHVLGETHERCHWRQCTGKVPLLPRFSGIGVSGGSTQGLFASSSGRPPQWRLSDILGCSCGCSSSVAAVVAVRYP